MMTLPKNLYLDGNVPIRELAEYLEEQISFVSADDFEDWIIEFQDSYDPVKE